MTDYSQKRMDWLNSVERVAGHAIKKSRSISEIEFIYHHLCLKVEPYTQKWQETFKAIAGTKERKAHCQPTHKFFVHEDKNFWLYKVSNSEYYGQKMDGISFDWVKEPETKLNFELGQAHYQASQKHEFVSGLKYKCQRILTHKIASYLYENYSRKAVPEQIVDFEINGRQYLYVAEPNRYVVSWKCLVWHSESNWIKVKL